MQTMIILYLKSDLLLNKVKDLQSSNKVSKGLIPLTTNTLKELIFLIMIFL